MNQNNIFESPAYGRRSIKKVIPFEVREDAVSYDLSNREVFTAVYNKLYPYAFFFAGRLVPKEEVADIIAGVFGKLWIQKKNFENLPHLKAYLRAAVCNTCITYLRNRSRRLQHEEISNQELADNISDDSFYREDIGAEKLSRIYTEIERLPFRCREVFKLAYLENLKNSEIARRLGITLRTVQNQKCSALKILRMTLLSATVVLLSTGLSFFYLP